MNEKDLVVCLCHVSHIVVLSTVLATFTSTPKASEVTVTVMLLSLHVLMR